MLFVQLSVPSADTDGVNVAAAPDSEIRLYTAVVRSVSPLPVSAFAASISDRILVFMLMALPPSY